LLDALHATSKSEAFLFGHHNTNFQGQSFQDKTGSSMRSDVAAGTNGTFPAMFGYNLDWVARQVPKANLTALVANARQAAKGGVLHMFWEAANPATGGGSNDLNGSPITAILPGGSANALWVVWMDRVAAFFLEIDTPAIFRPFHENTGGWFWWGTAAATPAQYKAAWNYTVDYLQSKGVHSLLYAYAPSKPASGGNWKLAFTDAYPGDERVDIECFDHYGHNDFHEDLLEDCEKVSGL
jgi:mannan endo-1,4-beta-mannosidase